MSRIMLNATNTMNQLQKQLDTISHNIANVETVGYKNRQTSFQELLVQQSNNQSLNQYETIRNTPMGIRMSSGAGLAQTKLNLSQGSLKTTDRMLDFALAKEDQFFTVQVTENGETSTQFTRNGVFYLSPINNTEVMLVTAEGHPVLGTNGQPIVLPENVKEVRLQPEGVILADLTNGQAVARELGMAQVIRPQMLQARPGSLFALPPAEVANPQDVVGFIQGAERNEISIKQGMLEQSNVDLASEMTEMTLMQRSYQFNARSVQFGDQMMGLVNGLNS
ncbi:flagellar hook-basal body protein [Sutcliffiella horikoshii]|uniref:Flagellar hook-basal body protein n=1 Tax=Sutcliffiella horikoshii TaxID=79883 RepID=A0A5D4T2T5_9BACI|nr:flagellar hook-basal body protein [Sutcliffiella horikoshii]TYS70017.1 flagellar hook-basal body protein [Sutcliffiella horikoshii]